MSRKASKRALGLPKRVRRISSKQKQKTVKTSLQQLRAALNSNNSSNNIINNNNKTTAKISPTSEKEHALVVEALVKQVSQASLLSRRKRSRFLRSSIIVVRRSTTTSCSEISFDASFCSDLEYDDDDDDLSEEESLVDDDDDDDDDEEDIDDKTTDGLTEANKKRILVLGFEPLSGPILMHPSRIITEHIQKARKKNDKSPTTTNTINSTSSDIVVEAAVILTDSKVDDDDKDDRYVLAMRSLQKHIERTQPDTILVLTEDSKISAIVVEGYSSKAHDTSTTATTQESSAIQQALIRTGLPTVAADEIKTNMTAHEPNVYHQWAGRIKRAGFGSASKSTAIKRSITFLHMPPYLPETAAYNLQPNLKAETSLQAISTAIAVLTGPEQLLILKHS